MKYMWIWCLFNTIGILMILMCCGLNSDAYSRLDSKIYENKKDIEKIEYHIQHDTTVMNHYIYINTKEYGN